jgi:hypothetical protein
MMELEDQSEELMCMTELAQETEDGIRRTDVETESVDGARLQSSVGGTRDSFALSKCNRVIESVVLPDGRSVRGFLGENRQTGEIARLVGEGIRREGLRRLEGDIELDQGRIMCEQMLTCETIESILRICAQFYTRNTFLYRRVNQFLRSSLESDPETGRNLGLYIGLLRECFCVAGGLSPLSWDRPQVVYRGASFSFDILADYARRPDESIRWQGFTSSSRDLKVALTFPGNVLFEISLTHSVASVDDISAFKDEHEYILSPYQWFSMNCVRWDADCGRWILAVGEDQDLPEVRSWFVGPDHTSQ